MWEDSDVLVPRPLASGREVVRWTDDKVISETLSLLDQAGTAYLFDQARRSAQKPDSGR